MMNCKILVDLPPKKELKWQSDYKPPSSCYICDGTEELRGWPMVMCREPPPYTSVCKECIIAWYENAGTTTEAIRAYRKKEQQNAT